MTISMPESERPVTNTDMEISRLQGGLRAAQEQQAIDRVQNNERFDRIDAKLASTDGKLDALLAAQQLAIGVRKEMDKRQDARARRLAGWTSVGTGLVIVVIGELVHYWLSHHTGIPP